MKSVLLSLFLALSIASVSAVEKYAYNEYYYQRASLFEVLNVDSDDVVMLGNSLTNGGDWHEIFNNANVKNRGIISDVIQGMYDRVDKTLEGKPAKLFLLGGVNDISHKIGADSIASALENLVDHIMEKSPSTKLYIQSLFPINNSFKRYRNLIGTEPVFPAANAKIKAMAERKGLVWIDVASSLADADGNLNKDYTSDGLHLNSKGYRVWSDVLAPYIGLAGEPLYQLHSSDIVIVGGSLVSGCEWHELLENANVKKRTNGDRASSLPALVKTVAEATPATIVISAEYNDLKGDIDASAIVEPMKKSIETVKELSPETKIVVVGLTPVNSSFKGFEAFAGKQKEIKTVNKQLKSLAKKVGAGWIDLYPTLSKKGELSKLYTNDGFHLMGVGYLKWRNELFKYITPDI